MGREVDVWSDADAIPNNAAFANRHIGPHFDILAQEDLIEEGGKEACVFKQMLHTTV